MTAGAGYVGRGKQIPPYDHRIGVGCKVCLRPCTVGDIAETWTGWRCPKCGAWAEPIASRRRECGRVPPPMLQEERDAMRMPWFCWRRPI